VNLSRFSATIETDKSGLGRTARPTGALGRAGRYLSTVFLASLSGIQLMSLGLFGEHLGTTPAEAEWRPGAAVVLRDERR